MPEGAFSMVSPACTCAYAVWQEKDGDQENFAWLRETSARIDPISLGHYVGEAILDLVERSRGSFSASAFERLKGLQRKYDPAGRFHRPGLAVQPLLKTG